MDQVLLYISIILASVSFFLCLYAHRRVTKIHESTKDLYWSALSNITGDLATLKKTIQTLNNRLNGIHSPKVQDEEILRYMANNQVANRNNSTTLGG